VELASPPVHDETKEREVNREAPGRAADILAELGEELESRFFTSTYYDTPNRALASAGITLRRTLENGKSVWRLKLALCHLTEPCRSGGGVGSTTG
jgi:hypothetical protein